MNVFIGGCYSFNRDVVVQHNAIEETIELFGVPCGHKQSLTIRMNFRLHDGVLLKDQCRNERGTITPNEDPYWMIFHLAANSLNSALGNHVPATHHNDAVRYDVYLVQNMT